MELQFTPYVFVPYDAANEVFTDWYRFPNRVRTNDIDSMIQEEMEEFIMEETRLYKNFQQMKTDLLRHNQQRINSLYKRMAEEGRI